MRQQKSHRNLTYVCCAIRLLLTVGLATSFVVGAQAEDGVYVPHHVTHPVTVADSIEMTRFANGLYELGVPSQDSTATWSPDRSRFALVLRRGNIAENTNQYFLVLFVAADIVNAPGRFETLVTVASSSNLPGISHVKWLNSTTVAFLKKESGDIQQVYAVNCNTRKVRKLIRWSTSIVAYDVTADLRRFVFIAEEPQKQPIDEKPREQGLIISNLPLSQVLGIQESYGHQYQLFLREGKRKPLCISTDKTIWGYSYPVDRWKLSISPDGMHAIVETRVANIPPGWMQYTNQTLQMLMRSKAEGPKTISTYLLADLSSGSIRPLLDTPNRDLSNYAWAPDGQSVVASNIFLPLSASNERERIDRKTTPYVAEVKLSREVVPITDKELNVIRWNPTTNEVLLRSKDSTLVTYRKTGFGWQQTMDAANRTCSSGDFDIRIEEGANLAPRIVSIAPNSQRKTLLLNLNPQFSGLQFGRVEVVAWKTSDGREVEGGLYWPPDYVAGKRYPLVIQTHGFDPERFYIDGPSTTAFAAQSLAGRGVVVLQIGRAKEKQTLLRDPKEGPREMATFEGAIDYLDDRGLIDRERVGLIGFSRTCYHVLYTITHSKYHFAAASVSDGVDGGYVQYVIGENLRSEITSWFEVVNAGPPFGSNLLSWFQSAPAFNLERVNTPLRIEALGLESALSEWEWLAGLKRLGKPVEGVLIPNAAHNLQKPWDRLISQGGVVDWFGFWLKGEEDSDSKKAEQYRRWRGLRKLEIQNKDSVFRPD